MAETSILNGKKDVYKGITVNPEELPNCTPLEFDDILKASLEYWRNEKLRGIWLGIPIEKSNLIPIAVDNGFIFHHAKPKYVMLNQWLPKNEPNKLPLAPSTSIGVGGFVLNDKNELLVVKEKYLANPLWKLPGGMAEPSEDIGNAAVREVIEETNIHTQFQSIICFRHSQHGIFDTSNIYIIVRLKPITLDIKIDEGEILEARWMPLDEYISDNVTSPLNKEAAILAKKNATETNGNPIIREFVAVDVDAYHKKWKEKVYMTGSAL